MEKRAGKRFGHVHSEPQLPEAVFEVHMPAGLNYWQRGSEHQGLVNLLVPGLHMNEARVGSKAIILLFSKEL